MGGRAAMLVAAAGLAACTFEPGRWFGALEASVKAAYVETPERSASGGAGWQRVDGGYEVKVTRAVLAIREILLLGMDGPVHTPVVALRAEPDLDLLAPAERRLGCRPSCNLGRAHVRHAAAAVTGVMVEGLVRDGRAAPRFEGERPFRWQARDSAGGPGTPLLTIAGELDLPFDREHDPEVRLDLSIEATSALFDGVDFASAPSGDGAIDLGTLPGAAARIETGLAAARLGALVRR
jgi:hypothetical protein